MLKQLTMALVRSHPHPQVEAVAAHSCTVRGKEVDRGATLRIPEIKAWGAFQLMDIGSWASQEPHLPGEA